MSEFHHVSRASFILKVVPPAFIALTHINSSSRFCTSFDGKRVHVISHIVDRISIQTVDINTKVQETLKFSLVVNRKATFTCLIIKFVGNDIEDDGLVWICSLYI